MVEREDVEISQRCVEAKGGIGRCAMQVRTRLAGISDENENKNKGVRLVTHL